MNEGGKEGRRKGGRGEERERKTERSLLKKYILKRKITFI